jgi:hypothetical protein
MLTWSTSATNKPTRPTPSGWAGAIADRLMAFLDLGFTAVNLIPLGPDPSTSTDASPSR